MPVEKEGVIFHKRFLKDLSLMKMPNFPIFPTDRVTLWPGVTSSSGSSNDLCSKRNRDCLCPVCYSKLICDNLILKVSLPYPTTNKN